MAQILSRTEPVAAQHRCAHHGNSHRRDAHTKAAIYRRGFALGGFYALLRAKRRMPNDVELQRVIAHLAVKYLRADDAITLQGTIE